MIANDGRHPNGSPVLTRFPATPEQEAGDRSAWAWVPGTVLERWGPDEWRVRVDAPELEEDGTFPVCYRAASELRPAPVSAFRCPCCGDDVFGTPPLCQGCRAAGCEQGTDGTGDLGWWRCQRQEVNHGELHQAVLVGQDPGTRRPVCTSVRKAACKEMITMTAKDDPMVVRELDKILPLAMRPTPSGARLDLRLYFTEDKDGQWLSVVVTDADDHQIGPPLPIDKPEGIGPYFDALAAKAYKVAAAKRTKPLQH